MSDTVKLYVRGSICQSSEIIRMFRKLGANNIMNYNCADPKCLYFINNKNEIDFFLEGSSGYHILINSDWEEVKPRETKKTRKFLISVKEGTQDCDNCSIKNYCGDKHKATCEITKSISNFSSLELDGSTANIIDCTELKKPPTSDIYWPSDYI